MPQDIPLREHQACFVIALKGQGHMKVDLTFVAETMCESMYNQDEIMAMELTILRTLDWYLNGPTCIDYLDHFKKLVPEHADDQSVSNFFEAAVNLCEEYLLEYVFALEMPSKLAIASFASVILSTDRDTLERLNASTWMSRVRSAIIEAELSQSL